MLPRLDHEVTVSHGDELQYLSERLGRIRFRPRDSLSDELLRARRPSRKQPVPDLLQPLIGLAGGTLLLGVLIYLFWHAMLQGAR